jgi:hypothetical protein
MYVMPNNLNRTLLEAALTGLEAQKDKIEEYIAAVRSQLGPERHTTAQPVRKKRRLSAAGRKAIGDAARKRWAAAGSRKAAAPPPARRKVKISAAGRKRIAAAQKKRWAAKRAADAPVKAAP